MVIYGFGLFSYFYLQNTYGAAIQTLEQVGKVVESLYAKVGFISARVVAHSDFM